MEKIGPKINKFIISPRLNKGLMKFTELEIDKDSMFIYSSIAYIVPL